jgi:hypothetical protein
MTYRISNTVKGQRNPFSCVRVYDDEGKMIAEQKVNERNPLKYIKRYKTGKYRAALKEQCLAGGMTSEIFEELF